MKLTKEEDQNVKFRLDEGNAFFYQTDKQFGYKHEQQELI